ncbi:MAG: methionine--tRNA ligase [Candidatus Pacebacteria bacterium]|nr:methionine--tRNA ligase [Candidatus Paceibacterota bacterium]
MITFSDFKKLEIKIGKVISVEKIPNADKLLKFNFDLGHEQRQIIAGIAEFFNDYQALVGQEMPILVNLEPKKIRGYESQGMILVADADGQAILLQPAQPVPPGTIVR